MDANVVEQWERMGWRFIGVLATLIILVCVWLPLASAINFGRFDQPGSNKAISPMQ